eukprot:scpid4276/ scgid3098/ 
MASTPKQSPRKPITPNAASPIRRVRGPGQNQAGFNDRLPHHGFHTFAGPQQQQKPRGGRGRSSSPRRHTRSSSSRRRSSSSRRSSSPRRQQSARKASPRRKSPLRGQAWNGQNLSQAFQGLVAQGLSPSVARNLEQIMQQQGALNGQSPQRRNNNTFVEANILYISNLHPAFTDDLLIKLLDENRVPCLRYPQPKINDRPLSKESAGEVKFKDASGMRKAVSILNGLDIGEFVKENIFQGQPKITVKVNGIDLEYDLEERRNIFAMKKMQRLQYEAQMCERGVFVFQLQKRDIQSSQQLYQQFDDDPKLQALVEQVRVAETRPKDGKAFKSRGCGHILFPDRATLAEAQVYLSKIGCEHTNYTRPLNDATKVLDKTFLRNPTNIHIKNIPEHYVAGEGRKQLEAFFVSAAERAVTGFAPKEGGPMRRLEINQNPHGYEGFASFCYYIQAQQVINELNGVKLGSRKLARRAFRRRRTAITIRPRADENRPSSRNGRVVAKAAARAAARALPGLTRARSARVRKARSPPLARTARIAYRRRPPLPRALPAARRRNRAAAGRAPLAGRMPRQQSPRPKLNQPIAARVTLIIAVLANNSSRS